MRELLIEHMSSVDGIKQRLGWDDPIPDNLKRRWKNFFNGLFELESLQFDRCLRPSSVTGDPMLVIFSDGSRLAYGTCAYIRWELRSGRYQTKLIAERIG